MGLLHRIQSATFTSARRAASRPASDPGWYVADPSGFWLPGESYVSADSAQTLSAVWQGVRLRSEGVASVPCWLMRSREDAGKDRVRSGPYAPLAYRLRWQPNDVQDAFQFWELAESHVLLRGIFVAEIVPSASRFGTQFVPRHPDRVTPMRLPSGRLTYRLTHELDGTPRYLSQDQVFVILGRTMDGVTPLSFLQYGARSIGAALAAQKMASTFFKKGSPAIAVISKEELGSTGQQNLHNSIMTYVGGADGSFGILPLEGDLTIEKLGLTPADSKLLEMLTLGVEDVARWLNIPLHMLRTNNTGTNSYASLEVFSAEFVTYGLRPDAIRFEHAIKRQLVLDDDKEDYFAEFLLDALLRGNLEQRAKFYQSAILTGWMSRNEVRDKENLNPVDGLDRFLEPQNTAQIDDQGDRRQSTHARVLHAAGRFRDAFRASMLANDLAMRVMGRERKAVEHLAKKHASDPEGWAAGLREFYADHAKFVAAACRVTHEVAREYAARRGAALESQGVAALDATELEAAEQLAIWALDGAELAA